MDDRIEVFWVGDTRVYAIDSAGVHRVTQDHTVAQYKTTVGRSHTITPRDHHLLTRCIGVGGYEVLDRVAYRLAPTGKRGLLVCSDGYGVVDDQEILGAFAISADADSWLQKLNRLVLERDAPDNFTAIAVTLP